MSMPTEERHTISSPRLILVTTTTTTTSENNDTNPSLSWEVDIYRDGVNDPIDTIKLNNETLPPRYNRKGKVVWRLPMEEGKLPSFGLEDKSRIMELFKMRKKSRKKALKAAATKCSINATVVASALSQEEHLNETPSQHQQPLPPPPGFESASDDPTPPATPTTLHSQDNNPPLCNNTPEHDTKLYFLTSSNTPPNVLPTTIAKSFLSTYYPYFTPTSPIHKLTYFYTPSAQKSISIGKAHSVVISKQEIFLQLQHVQQTITFSNIIGVVAQTSHLNAIHLLITGSILSSPNNADPHKKSHTQRSFAHSIQLVRSVVEFEDCEECYYGYQIQNDALALLNEVEVLDEMSGPGNDVDEAPA